MYRPVFALVSKRVWIIQKDVGFYQLETIHVSLVLHPPYGNSWFFGRVKKVDHVKSGDTGQSYR